MVEIKKKKLKLKNEYHKITFFKIWVLSYKNYDILHTIWYRDHMISMNTQKLQAECEGRQIP
jgi:hypothetical protein